MSRPSTRGRLVVGLLAAAVLAAAVVVGVLVARVVEGDRTASAADAGSRAAEALTPVLLGYDWTTIDADARRIAAVTTGPFADQNRAIVAGVVAPAAVDGRLTSRAAVTATAVLAATPERVESLVVYAQTTTTAGTPATVVRSARVVTVPDGDGQWLVAGFDAL